MADTYVMTTRLRGDHTANLAVLSGMRYRLRENVTKTYTTAAGTCTVEGALRSVASRPEETIEAHGDTALSRTRAMSVCNFEWLSDCDVDLTRRCTVSVTHCVTVVFDTRDDGSVDARIVMRVDSDAAHQLARVVQIMQALGQPSDRSGVSEVAATCAFRDASGHKGPAKKHGITA